MQENGRVGPGTGKTAAVASPGLFKIGKKRVAFLGPGCHRLLGRRDPSLFVDGGLRCGGCNVKALKHTTCHLVSQKRGTPSPERPAPGGLCLAGAHTAPSAIQPIGLVGSAAPSGSLVFDWIIFRALGAGKCVCLLRELGLQQPPCQRGAARYFPAHPHPAAARSSDR